MANALRISSSKTDFVVLFIGRFVSASIAFIAISCATRFLTPNQYGVYSIVIVFQGLSGLFLINPFGQFINRHLHEWQIDGSIRSRLDQYKNVIFIASLVGAFLSFIWATFEQSNMFTPIAMSLCTAALILCSSWTSSYTSYINLLGKRKPSVSITIIGLVIGLLMSITLTYFTGSVFGWIVGQILGHTTACILGRIYFTKIVSLQVVGPSNSFLTLEVFKKYILPLALATLLMWWITSGYRLALNVIWGPATLGSFAAGYAVAAGIVSSIEAVLSQYMSPRFFRSLAESSRESYSTIYSEIINLSVPLYIFACSLLLIVVPHIVNVVISSAYKGVILYASIGLIVESIRAISNTFNLSAQIIVSTGSLIPSYLAASVVSCISFFALRNLFNADIVISISIVIAYLVLLFFVVFMSSRELPFYLDKRLWFFSVFCFLSSSYLAYWLYISPVFAPGLLIIVDVILFFSCSILAFKRFVRVYRSCLFLA